MLATTTFNVAFFARPLKTQTDESNTPLRIRVWVAATKQHIYAQTRYYTTAKDMKMFYPDGRSRPGADPKLIRRIDMYKAAVNLVLSSALINDQIDHLTSELLRARLEAIVDVLLKDNHGPIFAYTTADNVPLCRACRYNERGKCTAPFTDKIEKAMATDLTLYNGLCAHHQPKTDIPGSANIIEVFSSTLIRELGNDPTASIADLTSRAFVKSAERIAAIVEPNKKHDEI